MCADCKPDACIVDVRYGPDRTINRQYAVKRCEVREMFLVCDIELCCDGRFARFEVEVDSGWSDLNFGALFERDKFDKMAYFEGPVYDIVNGGGLQPRKMALRETLS